MVALNRGKVKVEFVNPKKLKPHRFSTDLYGDDVDDAYVRQVEKYGIVDPIQVLPNMTVLGGHRRRQAAILAKLKEVPVVLRRDIDPDDEDAIREHIVILNAYREKTTEVKAREYRVLKEIEERKAAERNVAGGKSAGRGRPQQARENFPYPNSGKASDLAAAKVGMSGKTAEAAAEVVNHIDELEQAGEVEKAGELHQTLNKSVSKAAKAIKPQKTPEPFAEPIAKADWVLKFGISGIQEAALVIERELGYGAGNFSSGSVNNYVRGIHELFTGVKRALVHEQARQKAASPSPATPDHYDLHEREAIQAEGMAS